MKTLFTKANRKKAESHELWRLVDWRGVGDVGYLVTSGERSPTPVAYVPVAVTKFVGGQLAFPRRYGNEAAIQLATEIAADHRKADHPRCLDLRGKSLLVEPAASLLGRLLVPVDEMGRDCRQRDCWAASFQTSAVDGKLRAGFAIYFEDYFRLQAQACSRAEKSGESETPAAAGATAHASRSTELQRLADRFYPQGRPPEYPTLNIDSPTGWSKAPLELQKSADAFYNRETVHDRLRALWPGDHVRATLVGDSMEPEYRDGAQVVLQIIDVSDARSVIGQDCMFYQRNGKGTFKRLEAIKRGTLILRPLNKAKFPEPMKVKLSELQCLAVVKGNYEARAFGAVRRTAPGGVDGRGKCLLRREQKNGGSTSTPIASKPGSQSDRVERVTAA